MRQILIKVKDFSKTPGTRSPSDGPFSAVEFREGYLKPALQDYDVVYVDFDGTQGFASCFLEEAFRGLILSGFISSEKALKKMRFKSLEEPELIEEVKEYLRCN